MNKSLKLIITLSIMFNLMLVGIVIGVMSRGIVGSPPPHMPPSSMVNNLPPDKRDEFQHVMDKVNKDTEELRDELHEAHKKLSDIVKADTFDQAAYVNQMQRIHELHGKLADHMAQAIADLASKWPAKDRQLLAEVVRGPLIPGGHDGPPPGNHDGPPPPPPGDAPPH